MIHPNVGTKVNVKIKKMLLPNTGRHLQPGDFWGKYDFPQFCIKKTCICYETQRLRAKNMFIFRHSLMKL